MEQAGFDVGLDRHVLASFESGRRRSLSVDELFALATVLDVSPTDLIVDDSTALQIGKWTVAPEYAGRWIRGDDALPSQDKERWIGQRSKSRAAPRRRASAAEIAVALRDHGLEIWRGGDDDGER